MCNKYFVKKIRKIAGLIFLLVLATMLYNPAPVYAASPLPALIPVPGTSCDFLQGAQKTECKKAICPSKPVQRTCNQGKCIYPNENPVEETLPCNFTLDDIMLTVINFAKIMIGITGSLMLAFFVVGGYTMVTSVGNAEEIKKGRDALTAAFVGGIIVLGATILVNFAAGLLGGQLSKTPGGEIEFTTIPPAMQDTEHGSIGGGQTEGTPR